MNSSKNIILAVLHLSLMAVLVSCEKVSPIGVLVAGTGVEDRVKMSSQYFKEYMADLRSLPARGEEYTFLVGADSHVTTDLGRIDEMFQIGLDNDDLLYAHLGDIADTKAEYYINLSKSIEKAKMAYAEKYYDFVEIEDEKTDQHLTCFIDPAKRSAGRVKEEIAVENPLAVGLLNQHEHPVERRVEEARPQRPSVVRDVVIAHHGIERQRDVGHIHVPFASGRVYKAG